jgi:hypothetical protein
LKEDSFITEKLVDFFYKANYSNDLPSILSEDPPSLLDIQNQQDKEVLGHDEFFSAEKPGKCCEIFALHTQMYIVGDKYAVIGLKELAQTKMEVQAGTCCEHEGFFQAVQDTYGSTMDNDRGLRDICVKAALRRIAILSQLEAFQALMKDTPDFMFDLFQAQQAEQASKRQQAYTLSCKNHHTTNCTRCNKYV